MVVVVVVVVVVGLGIGLVVGGAEGSEKKKEQTIKSILMFIVRSI